ncbi:integrating conjugative element protein, PFL_4695 family [Cedecea neteri]|uniref:Integrating conjugative element protein, PFL_4695 family n=1 Tax=Cedecea neteri TaxID=158822 RepID=A0A2X2SXR7_9ENTR|nr:integrating conjugative element protein, PFL_4695 family [Cedecea neteri]
MKMLSFSRSFLFSGLLSVLLFPALTAAALHVIADVGGADAAPFYGSINRQDGTPQALPPATAPGQDEAAMLPVTTPELTPGAVSDRPLQLPGIGALFLVGEDPGSRTWLCVMPPCWRRAMPSGWW